MGLSAFFLTTTPAANGSVSSLAPLGYFPPEVANFNQGFTDSYSGFHNVGDWVIADGKLTASQSTSYYAYADKYIPAGRKVVTFRISRVENASPLRMVINNCDQYPDAVGTYEYEYNALGAVDRLHFGGMYGFKGDIDWVQVLPAPLLINGDFNAFGGWTAQSAWTIGNGVATVAGGYGNGAGYLIQETGAMVVGDTYRLSVNCLTLSAGQAEIFSPYNGLSITIAAPGQYHLDFVAQRTTYVFYLTSYDAYGTFDFVRVERLPVANTGYGNRALQFTSGQGAYFYDHEYDAALSDTTWELEARLKLNESNGDYKCAFGRFNGTFAEYAIFCKAGRFAFNSYVSNSTGVLIYKEIPVTVPYETWVTVKFTYDGTTLQGYLDDVLHYTETVTFTFLPHSEQSFRVGNANNQYFLSGSVDYVKVKRAGVLVVDIDFNETNGFYTDKISNKTLILENGPTSIEVV